MTRYTVDGAPEPFDGPLTTLGYVKQPDGTYFVEFTSTEKLPRVEEVGLVFKEHSGGKVIGEAIFDYGPPVAPVTRTKLPDGSYQYTFVARQFVIRGTFSFPDSAPPCFVRGTEIETPDGPRRVEDLVAGDRLVLADGGTANVTWVGHRRCTNAAIVRIRAGSLPRGPSTDLLVSDDHGIFLDGSLVPAGLLVDNTAITREHRDDVSFFHVEADRHAVLLANGAPAETYLDTGNRAKFANCPLAYDELATGGPACADMILAGPRLARLRTLVGRSTPALAD